MAQDTNRRSIISRRPSINTQAETKAANIWWKLCNIWGVEAQVFSIHGPTGQHFSTIASKNRKSNNRVLYRCRAASCSNNTWRRREVDTTVQQPQIHTHQHHLRCSSNGLGLEVYRQLCNRFAIPVGTRSIGYLTKLLKPRFDNNNFWRVLLNMGIWACPLWAWPQCTTTRPGEDSSPHEPDNRTTSKTSTPQRRHHTNLCRSEGSNHGALKNQNSVLKTPTTLVLSSTNFGGGPAPMNIGATYKGNGKGKGKNKGKGYGKGNKGKGYRQGEDYGGYGIYNKGKSKGKQQPWYQPKGGDKGNKGKARGMPNKA